MTGDLNDRLAEAREKQRQLMKHQDQLGSLRRSLELEQRKLAELDKQLRKEDRDVEKLEGLSLNGLFYTVLGSKEQQLEKERQEYLAAKLKHDKSRFLVSNMEAEAAALERQIDSLKGAEDQVEMLLAEKEASLRQAGDEHSRQLVRLAEELSQAQSESRELGEALQAGEQALLGLEHVIDTLRSAGNWGTWDMLGGGFLATAVKHSRIDEAKEAVYQVQQVLLRFQRELADVGRVSGQIVTEMGAFETFADYFFDGLIFDWVVQSRIQTSLDNAIAVHQQASRIVADLNARLERVKIRVGRLQEDKQRLVEQA